MIKKLEELKEEKIKIEKIMWLSLILFMSICAFDFIAGVNLALSLEGIIFSDAISKSVVALTLGVVSTFISFRAFIKNTKKRDAIDLNIELIEKEIKQNEKEKTTNIRKRYEALSEEQQIKLIQFIEDNETLAQLANDIVDLKEKDNEQENIISENNETQSSVLIRKRTINRKKY